MKKKIYIAGKVTGEPYEKCCRKFIRYERWLEKAGFDVVNPIRLVQKDTPWRDAMRLCISQLMQCNGIYMLPDWKESPGATRELQLAIEFGIPVLSNMIIEQKDECKIETT